jgi:hypothetical protein
LILLLASDSAAAASLTPARPDLQIRSSAGVTVEQVLEWLAREPFERIVAQWSPAGLNPFALSRALRALRTHPPLFVVSPRLPYMVFWAARMGCQIVENLEEALSS